MSVAEHALVGTELIIYCMLIVMLNFQLSYSHVTYICKICVCDVQTCVRSSVTSPMRMNAAGLLFMVNTVWMLAAAQSVWPGALNVTNVQRKALQNMPSSVPVAQASHIGVTLSMGDPFLKVMHHPQTPWTAWVVSRSLICSYHFILYLRYKWMQDDKHPVLKWEVQKHHRQFPLSLW